MQNKLLSIFLLITIVLSFQGCAVIADIFKAGMWVGVLGVVLILVLIGFLIRKMNKP